MKSKTIIATPPGATIREQLEDRGMTQKEFAARMGISAKHASQLVNGEVQLTPDMALRLEYVLGVPAKFWLNLEAIYQEKCARIQTENDMATDEEIAKKFPYSDMVSFGWIAAAASLVEKVYNLRVFFGVARLTALSNLLPYMKCRRVSSSEKADYALAAWAQQAKVEARDVPVSPISLAKLKSVIPQMRAMTLEPPEVFCGKLQTLMAQCGVALVLLPHLPGSYLHGATFYDGDKIVMGLTVRGKDADRFWFSLFHELAHILKGHISHPEGPDEAQEDEANQIASNILIPPSDLERFAQANDFDSDAVIRFASNIGIAPGIVVGRLQKEGLITHNRLNGLKQQYTFE